MLRDTEWAVRPSFALGQLLRFVLADVVSFALALVAALTEVSGAPAEPLRNAAAVAAFEIDEFRSVHLAILFSVLDSDRSARATYELLRLEHLLFLLSANAILLATEVGTLALETLIVGQLEHGPILKVIVKLVIGVRQTRVLF